MYAWFVLVSVFSHLMIDFVPHFVYKFAYPHVRLLRKVATIDFFVVVCIFARGEVVVLADASVSRHCAFCLAAIGTWPFTHTHQRRPRPAAVVHVCVHL